MLITLALAPRAAAFSVLPDPSEDDVVLLAVRLDRVSLDAPLVAIQRPGRILVPLGSLAQILELEISVEAARGVARGQVGRNRRVSLDLDARTARSDGRPIPLDSLDAEAHRDDLYLDSRWLGSWLPLDLGVDLRAALLTVHPREPLPIELRRRRMVQAQHALASAQEPVDPAERAPAPYRAWALPAFDLALQWLPSSRFRPGRLDHSAAASGDLLWLETRAWASGDQVQPLRDVRWTSGRREPEPRLLGPLRAREFAVGEVYDPGLDLVSLPGAGGGAMISSFPLETSGDERRLIRGELPPGWDVELYRNDALVGYQPAGATGTYEFRDVPLDFGANVLRLQFYGPGGETRSETRLMNFGDAVAPAREVRYRLDGFEAQDHRRRGAAELATGLAPGLSATARVAAVDLDDGRHDYVAGGLRGEYGPLFARADLAFDRAGGEAAQAAVTARLARWTLGLQQALPRGFRSEVFRPTHGPVSSRSAARLDGEVRVQGLPALPASFEWRRDGLERGGAVHTLAHQLSARLWRVSLTNRLEETVARVPGPGLPSQRLGRLLVGGGIGRLLLRGGLEYRLERPLESRRASFTAETWARGDLHASASLERDLETRANRAYAEVASSGGPVSLGLRSDYQPGGGLGVSLRLSMGLRPDQRTGRWHAQNRPATQAGAVSARVFLDANADGRMDAGERPLPGATLVAEGAGLTARTDDQGLAFLPGLGGGRAVRLRLATETLDDPLWVPERAGETVLPRAGATLPVEIPVIVTGEVSGTLSILRYGFRQPLAGIALELRDARTREVLRTTRSAYDGFYDLAGLRPGRYILALASREEARLGVAPTSLVFGIRPDGTVLEAASLTLEPNPVAGSPDSEADPR